MNNTTNNYTEQFNRAVYLALIVFSILNYAVNGFYNGLKYKGGDFLNYYLIGKLIEDGVDIHNDAIREQAAKGYEAQNPRMLVKKHHQPDYPIFWYAMFMPLNAFRWEIAFYLWTLANQFFLLAAIYLLFKYFKIRLISLEGAFSLTIFLNYWPLWSNMMEGQVNVFLLFLIIAGLSLFKKDIPWAAGLLLGLAAGIKIVPAFLVFFFLFKGHWKVVIWSAVGFALTVVISAVMASPDLVISYFTTQLPKYGGIPRPELFNQSINGFVSRLFTQSPSAYGLIDNQALSNGVTLVLNLMVLGLTLFFSRGKFALAGKRWNLGFALFITAMLLMSSWTMEHHFVFLYFVWLALSAEWSIEGKTGMQGLVLTALLLAFSAVNLPYQTPKFASGIFILLLSLKFYPVLGLWLITGIKLHRTGRE